MFNALPSALRKISIHAPLRERRFYFGRPLVGQTISIHAPLRERPQIKSLERGKTDISIHAPLRERLSRGFPNSTLVHFNPRSLTGATSKSDRFWLNSDISIHAPLRERLFGTVFQDYNRPFQSTLPYGSDLSQR